MEMPETKAVGKAAGSIFAILLFSRILHAISSAILVFEVPYAAFVLFLAGAYVARNGFGMLGGKDHDHIDIAL